MSPLLDPWPSKVTFPLYVQRYVRRRLDGMAFPFCFLARKVEIWGQIWMVSEEKSVLAMAWYYGHHALNHRVQDASLIFKWYWEGHGVETGRDMAVKTIREWRIGSGIVIHYWLQILWLKGGMNPYFLPEMVPMIHSDIEARNIGWWYETELQNSHKHMC